MSKRANEKALEEFPIVGDLHLRNAYISGYHQAEKDLGWHSVDECLPEMGEEAIVMADIFRLDGFCRIGFGYIMDNKSSATNGWNIPGVRFWMPMPKIPEE